MPDVPAGIKPLYVSNKQKEKYGLSADVPFKWFPKGPSLEEIAALGFYSLFYEAKAEITAAAVDEILIIADPGGKYGENYYFVLDAALQQQEIKRIEGGGEEGGAGEGGAGVPAGIDPEEAARIAAAEAEAKRRAEEQAKLDAMTVHEEPLVVRTYRSATAHITEEEVKDLTVRRSRPILAVRLQRRRYNFGAPCAFNDRENEGAVAEFRPRKDPAYDLKRRELSVGLQAGPSALSGKVSHGAQTTWFAPVTTGIQADCDAEASAMAGALPLAIALGGGGSSSSSSTAIVASSGAGAAAKGIMAGAGGNASRGGTAGGRGGALLGGNGDNDPTSNLRALIKEAITAVGKMDAGLGLPTAPTTGPGAGGAPPGTAGATTKVSKEGTPMERLVSFLRRSLSYCEHALSQNETLNIFRNELMVLRDKDEDLALLGGGSNSGDAKHIREERQFMDLELSHNKALTAIEWHPRSPAWLAVAVMPRVTFERRVMESSAPKVSHILLFTLSEFSCQLVLEVPAEMSCLHWNPSNTHLLAVGCMNGQVCLFDMAEAHAAMAARRKAGGGGGGGKGGGDADGSGDGASGSGGADAITDGSSSGGSASASSKALVLQPKFTSAIEASHMRAVVAVHWLPVQYHLNHRYQFQEDRDGEVTQFLSCGSDGGIAVWDTKFKERSRAAQRRRGSDAGAAGGKAGSAVAAAAAGGNTDGYLSSNLVPGALAAEVPAPPIEFPWQPLYRITVRSGGGSSPVHMTCVLFNEKVPSDPLVVGTEEGRFVALDWAPSGEGTGQDPWINAPDLATAAANGVSGKGEGAGADGGNAKPAAASSGGGGGGSSALAEADDGTGGGGTVARVLWTAQDGDRPFVAMQRHPTLSNIFLTVTDFYFSVWRRGVKQPIFVSASAPAPLTAGRWSPTRPAVLFIGRADGVVEAWDLLDSTVKPVVSLPLMSVAVTAMDFRLTGAGGGGAGGTGSLGAGGSAAAAAAAGTTAASLAAATGAPHKQYLAVGDAKGSLHVLDIPLPLRKGGPQEEALLSAYLDRELSRVAYIANRAVYHEQEKQRKDAENQKEQAAKDALQSKQEAELQAAQASMMEKDPSGARALTYAVLERQKVQQAKSAAEDKYKQLEKQIMAELGVKMEDVLPVVVLPPDAYGRRRSIVVDPSGPPEAHQEAMRAMAAAATEAHAKAMAKQGGQPQQGVSGDGFGASENAPAGATRREGAPAGAAMMPRKALSGSGAAAARTLASATTAAGSGAASPSKGSGSGGAFKPTSVAKAAK